MQISARNFDSLSTVGDHLPPESEERRQRSGVVLDSSPPGGPGLCHLIAGGPGTGEGVNRSGKCECKSNLLLCLQRCTADI